jgi:hypothetical protein
MTLSLDWDSITSSTDATKPENGPSMMRTLSPTEKSAVGRGGRTPVSIWYRRAFTSSGSRGWG